MKWILIGKYNHKLIESTLQAQIFRDIYIHEVDI